jgi:hypothetical protein
MPTSPFFAFFRFFRLSLFPFLASFSGLRIFRLLFPADLSATPLLARTAVLWVVAPVLVGAESGLVARAAGFLDLRNDPAATKDRDRTGGFADGHRDRVRHRGNDHCPRRYRNLAPSPHPVFESLFPIPRRQESS